MIAPETTAKAAAVMIGLAIGIVICVLTVSVGVFTSYALMQWVNEDLASFYGTMTGLFAGLVATLGVLWTLDALQRREERRRNGLGGGRG